MPAKNVHRGCRGLPGDAEKTHARFIQGPSAFAVVTMGTGSYYVRPGVRAAKMARYYVVDGQVQGMLTAVLAGVPVTAKNLTAG